MKQTRSLDRPLRWDEVPPAQQRELLAFAAKNPTWLWNEVLALAGLKPGTLASAQNAREIRQAAGAR